MNSKKHDNAGDSSGPLTVRVEGRDYKIDFRTFYSAGKRRRSSCLYLRVSRGKQVWINLNTADGETAVERARQVILEGAGHSSFAVEMPTATIGQYLKSFKELQSVSEATFNDYSAKVLRIVAWIMGIEATPATRGIQRKRWEEKVNAVRLSALREADLRRWRERQKALCQRDSDNRLSPRSPNGQIAAWWAVFRESSLWNLFGIEKAPGLGLKKLKVKKVSFRELVPLQYLIGCAKEELKESDPACYDLFLLAAAFGLRLKEADLLTWSAFQFEAGILAVKASALYGLKTYSSEGDINIHSDVLLEHFRSRFELSDGCFVIESERSFVKSESGKSYRCQIAIARLREWLRGKGVVCGKPIHYLRGAAGNRVRVDNDIFAAKCFLRHSNIQTTIEFYSEADLKYSTTLRF